MRGLTRKSSDSQPLHCPGLQLRARAARLDDQSILRLGDGQGQRKVDRPLLAEGPARGTGDPRDLPARVRFEPGDLDREVVALAQREERIGRIERGLADAAREIRNAQPGEHLPVGKRFRRKRHRHADHRRRPGARLLPEHGPAPVVADPGTRRGKPGLRGQERAAGAADGQHEEQAREEPPAPQCEQQGRKAEQHERPGREGRRIVPAHQERHLELLGHREGRDAVGRVALQKVEDLVAARIEAGRKRGPRNRSLRGDRRRERRVPASLLQLGEGGKLALSEHFLDHVRVHAVETEDDDTAGRRGGSGEEGRRGEGQRAERHGELLHAKP